MVECLVPCVCHFMFEHIFLVEFSPSVCHLLGLLFSLIYFSLLLDNFFAYPIMKIQSAKTNKRARKQKTTNRCSKHLHTYGMGRMACLSHTLCFFRPMLHGLT